MSLRDKFLASLGEADPIASLREGQIGNGLLLEGRNGIVPLLYADYVASGRALSQIESFVASEVLPFYGNSHTEASLCGRMMTRMREEARAIIAAHVKAAADCHVIFAGGGATAGLNRITRLLGLSERIAAGERIVVIIGPYEHHSNILPWRETGAAICEIPEAETGGPDLAALEAALIENRHADLVIGSFSAASNVTGIVTDPDPVTRLLKRYGARSIWDYAAGAPYLEMDMRSGTDCAKDAIVYSSHKFPGGPGASGIMVVRDNLVRTQVPTAPGGGSVVFVSPWKHHYSSRVESREEAGTPNVIGDIRAALVILLKDWIGTYRIVARETELRSRALEAWRNVKGLRLLGQRESTEALPIFSFVVHDAQGPVHHQLFTRLLSDVYGIQARGGCACAGPYAHRLLEIDEEESQEVMDLINHGEEDRRPGWVRLNLGYLLSDQEADRIIESVRELVGTARSWEAAYSLDRRTARFAPLHEDILP
ncbi:aminotransferase class V-fold PLP-dependent enzyme [Aquamicrobium soli]|jgi:selenocysteine lyase/cysteine desulfurase|uniref:Aminotransferase class V-fold PLP-dependent enzyme n=1 Tax=Aquamicrobium soli TaxID=1811518 RepID=A0ABV7K5Y2_9HYPH